MNKRWHLPTKNVLKAIYNKCDGYQYTGYKGSHFKRVRAVRALPEGHTERENVFKIDDINYQAYKEDAPDRMSWKDARKYCKELNK